MTIGGLNEIFPSGYSALRRMASSYLRTERPGHTLEPAALVNEAYLVLASVRQPNWDGLAHVAGAASRAMRRILVDDARARGRAKRGGGNVPISIRVGEVPEPLCRPSQEVRDAIRDLRANKPSLAVVVELRCFEGLSVEETAEALGISSATVSRRWAEAAEWLRVHLGARSPERLAPMRSAWKCH